MLIYVYVRIFIIMLIQMHEHFAPAGEDEPNTFNVVIDETMTPQDVMNSILRIIEKS